MSEKFSQEFAKYDADGSGTIGKMIWYHLKVECASSVVITSEFRIGQHRDGDNQIGAPHFTWWYNSILDINEAKAFVAAIGAGIPDAKVEEYFKKYDTDGNGSLDKDECLKLVKDIFPEFQ